MKTTHLIAKGLAVAAAFGCCRAAAQDAAGLFERELEVGAPLELDVRTGAGAIAVRTGGNGRAIIVGHIRAHDGRGRSAEAAQELVRQIEADPPIELAGNRLRVGHLPENDRFRAVSISYEIEAPAQTQLVARSGAGALTISDLDGPVKASTGSGEIALENVRGSSEARTGNGAIRLERIGGDIHADTGSGSISVEQVRPGDIAASTGSGSVRILGVDGSLRATTGSGGLTVEGVPRGPWELQSGSGSIVLRLPQDAAFHLEAHAGSGGVVTDHPVAVRGDLARGRVTGDVRGGGPTVRVRTGSGGIRLE